MQKRSGIYRYVHSPNIRFWHTVHLYCTTLPGLFEYPRILYMKLHSAQYSKPEEPLYFKNLYTRILKTTSLLPFSATNLYEDTKIIV